jgi:hypothetical protein
MIPPWATKLARSPESGVFPGVFAAVGHCGPIPLFGPKVHFVEMRLTWVLFWALGQFVLFAHRVTHFAF